MIAMRPELMYPLQARAQTREALGDLAGAAADRELVRRRLERNPPIWANADPFRY